MVSTCWTSSSFMARGGANGYKLCANLHQGESTELLTTTIFQLLLKPFLVSENALLALFRAEVSILIGYKNTFCIVCSVKRVLLDSSGGSTLVNVGKKGWPERIKASDPPPLLWYVNACPHPCVNALPFVQETRVSIFKGNARNKSTLNELRAADMGPCKSPAMQHWSARDHHLLSSHTCFRADCSFILNSFYP